MPGWIRRAGWAVLRSILLCRPAQFLAHQGSRLHSWQVAEHFRATGDPFWVDFADAMQGKGAWANREPWSSSDAGATSSHD